MKTITMKSGLELEIRDNLMNDMELLDDLSDLNEGDGYAISRVLSKILAPDQKKKLYDHHRNDDGKVPVDAIVDSMKEIFELLGDKGKNS